MSVDHWTSRAIVVFIVLSLLLGGWILVPNQGRTSFVDHVTFWDTSIQDAIDFASPGDTVNISDGTYSENLVIDKTITLVGNGSSSTTINGGGEGDVIIVLADNVNISGLSITNTNRLYSGIDLVNSSSSTISNCSFLNNLYGVRIGGSSNTIVNCDFNDNIYGTSIGRYPRDVLLMGNSYTYGNNLDQLVEGLFKNSISDPNTERLTNGGLNLSNHASMAQTPGHNWNVTLNDDNSWDYVLLQDQSQIPGFPTTSPYWKGSLEGARILNSMIEDVGGETVFLMTWGRRFGDPSNSLRYPDYLTMQKHLENGYRWFAENVSSEKRPAYIAPVGLAWKYIYDMINETGDPTTPGTLFYDLYTADSSHPSLYGSYLAACVIYATLTGDSPIGLTDGLAITSTRRLALQAAAHETVLNGTPDYVYPWQYNLHNKVERSVFESNDVAIAIGPRSIENTLVKNNLSRSKELGVLITDGTCDGNWIHGNEFIHTLGGGIQVKDIGVNNSWDDGSRGNYWSDMISRHPEAVPDGDVWDTPYIIDDIKNISDRYPIFDPSRDLDRSPPVADAGDDITVDECTVIILNGSRSYDNRGIENYTWTFEFNGTIVLLYGEEVLFNFTIPGRFNVSLTVRDKANNSDTDELLVIVVELVPEDTTPPFPPEDDLPNIKIEPGETAFLFAGNWTEDLSGIVEYRWNFTYDGIDIRLFGNETYFQFDIQGNYALQLKVTNDVGLFTIVTFWINVTSDHEPPTAVAGSDIVIDQGIWITLNGSESSDNEGITNFTWTIEDLETVSLNGSVVEYIFSNAGRFNVTLNVTDGNGNWAVDVINVTVNDTTPPVAFAGWNMTFNMHTIVNFQVSGNQDNVGIVRYEWFLFDGEMITLLGLGPYYTFHNAGIFNITLIVYDAAGNYDIDTVVFTVMDTENPKALINSDPDMVKVGDIAHFDGSDSVDNVKIVNWTWWINGTLRYGPEILYSFIVPGNHMIILTVKDAADNWGDEMLVVEVLPAPNTEAPGDDGEDNTNKVSFIERIIIPVGLMILLLASVVTVIFVMKRDMTGKKHSHYKEE